MKHAAIDLGGRESQICIRAADGTILEERRHQTRLLPQLMKSWEPSRVILETSAEAFAIADAAVKLGHQVRVVPATLVKTLGVGDRGVKNDRKDARKLSEVSCRIDLPSVHVPSDLSRRLVGVWQSRGAGRVSDQAHQQRAGVAAHAAWWAVWYPGAEPGGGSYIAQRMLASKSEKDSLGGVLFFNVAHYVLRPWPWILVALCSLLVYPELTDIQKAFPSLDPKLLGHDIAYPAMLKFLPVGFIGLMVGGLIAANSSTILTHLNWGASYLVHDFYRRFVRRDADEHHYVRLGRLSTIGLFLCASGMVYLLDTAKGAFDVILQVGAGTGLLYLVRWFWWRVNAWCEVVAMVSSFAISMVLLILAKQGAPVSPRTSV